MYSLPSTSQTRAPSARAMNTGSAPTERKARTGEFTPPGMDFFARSNRSLLVLRFTAVFLFRRIGLFGVGDALFLERLRLALGLRRQDGRIELDLLVLVLLLLGQPLDRGD